MSWPFTAETLMTVRCEDFGGGAFIKAWTFITFPFKLYLLLNILNEFKHF